MCDLDNVDIANEFLRFGNVDEKTRSIIESLIDEVIDLRSTNEKVEGRLNNLQESVDKSAEYLKPLYEMIKLNNQASAEQVHKTSVIQSTIASMGECAEQYMQNLVDEIGK